jgi:hypothetical protein
MSVCLSAFIRPFRLPFPAVNAAGAAPFFISLRRRLCGVFMITPLLNDCALLKLHKYTGFPVFVPTSAV